MTEWLTTGQMIDRLKVGEIAQLEKKAQVPLGFGPSYKHVTKVDDGDICWCTGDKQQIDKSLPVALYGHTVNWKWRILPNYVTFDEAMKALKEGKIVSLLNESETRQLSPFTKDVVIQHLDGTGRNFDSWFKGKWLIKD